MNKKLILLILALPLFLMISLFTATNTVSLAVSVPVSKIEYTGDSVVYLDLDQNETYYPEYTIYPTSAANKKVDIVTEPIGENPLCNLLYVDGYIIPTSPGMAKVYLTTVDGGYRAGFIVQVNSVVLKAVHAEVTKDELYVGEIAMIGTTFEPTNASDTVLTYTSTNPSVASVNDKGMITALSKGTASIIVASESNPDVFDVINVTVHNKDALDISHTEITTSSLGGSLMASVDSDGINYRISCKLRAPSGELLPDGIVDLVLTDDEGVITLEYAFKDSGFYGSFVIELTIETELGLTVTKTCTVERVKDISLKFDSEGTPSYFLGNNTLTFTLTPEDADVSYTYSASNDNVTGLIRSGSRLIFKAEKTGVTTITLTAVDNDNPENTKTVTIDIVILPRSITITETGKSYGDEDQFVIGSTDAAGQTMRFPLTATFGKEAVGHGFYESVTWMTDADPAAVDITSDGKLAVLDSTFNGVVNVYCLVRYGTVEYKSEPMRILCVGNAVNVYSYADLLSATRQKKPVVLHTDIIEDFGAVSGTFVYENYADYTEILSTYDTDKYGEGGATVKVLISFYDDVYGNGHTINAHNVTYRLDATGALKSDAIFKGPLNFVDMTEGDVSKNGGMVSVKAQDNIAFAVYDDVSLRNVTLKSCDLEEYEGTYDLTDLNYVGTTVEVFGDNVDIAYSRLYNGRVVLRAFGTIDDPTESIHINISNSVLSSAREFILRMGSNQFMQGDYDEPSPDLRDEVRGKLTDGSLTEEECLVLNSLLTKMGGTYPVQKIYDTFTPEEQALYQKLFIRTFVTVKNTAFRDAGIFAIGVDTHFAGGALADGTQFKQLNGLIDHWQGMAKTAYGAMLTFEGDVRMYCWKPLEEVDSSTLIEIIGTSEYAEQLNFNVAELVRVISEKPGFTNVIKQYNGRAYVHAGIAFFGGGKNYGVMETKDYSFHSFNKYEIGLSDTDAGYLQAAAGEEKFYFILHDATSTFTPEEQENMLANDAYGFISKKD